MVFCRSAGAGSCSDDLCFRDLFLAARPQGEGTGAFCVEEISLVEVRKVCMCVYDFLLP